MDKLVLTVADFPSKGTIFYDIAPLLQSPHVFTDVLDAFAAAFADLDITAIAALESRGFAFGAALAAWMQLPLHFVRKPGKLPGKVVSVGFDLEYRKGETIEMQCGSLKPNDRVLVVDDVFATGGTVLAATHLITEKLGATVAGVCVLLRVQSMSDALLSRASKALDALRAQNVRMCSLLDSSADGRVTRRIDPLLYALGPLAAIQVAPPREWSVDAERLVEDSIATLACRAGVSFSAPPPAEAKQCSRIIVMCHPSLEELAVRMVASHPHVFRYGKTSWRSFPDGFPNLSFESPASIRGHVVVFLLAVSDPATVMEQQSLLIALARQGIQLVVVNPYFGPATMERVENEGTVATAETFMKTITAPLERFPYMLMLDVHSLANRFYPSPATTIHFESALPLLLDTIARDKLTVVCPDDGSYKRFREIIGKKVPIVALNKVRGANDSRSLEVSLLANMDAFGPDHDYWNHLIVVDDLVHTGGTLVEALGLLRRLATQKTKSAVVIDAYVTHAIFERDSYLKFAPGGVASDLVGTFYVTNTVPSVARVLRAVGKPFVVLDVTPVITTWVMDLILPLSTNAGRNYDVVPNIYKAFYCVRGATAPDPLFLHNPATLRDLLRSGDGWPQVTRSAVTSLVRYPTTRDDAWAGFWDVYRTYCSMGHGSSRSGATAIVSASVADDQKRVHVVVAIVHNNDTRQVPSLYEASRAVVDDDVETALQKCVAQLPMLCQKPAVDPTV